MKKLTAGIFAGILTVVTVGVANADIASTTYVDKQATAAQTAAEQTAQDKLDTAVSTLEGKITKAQSDAESTANAALNTHKTEAAAAYQLKSNIAKTIAATVDAASDDKYPSEKAVRSALNATGGDVTALTGRVATAETDIANLEKADEAQDALIQANTDKFANYSTTAQMNAAIKVTDDKLANYATTTALGTTNANVTNVTNRVATAEGKITDLETADGEQDTAISSLQSSKQDKLGYTAENTANKTGTLDANSSATQYPTAKATYEAIEAAKAVASGANSTLTGRVATAETDIANLEKADEAQDALIQANTDKFANYSTTTEMNEELAKKQNTLTFDDAPTVNSANPVKSGGVYTALSGKEPTLTGAKLAAVDSGITAQKITDMNDATAAAKSVADGAVSVNTQQATAITNLENGKIPNPAENTCADDDGCVLKYKKNAQGTMEYSWEPIAG